MSDISEKTRIPIAWAATIVITMVGVVFNAGAAHYRLASVEARQAEMDKAAITRELKIQKLEIVLENIKSTVESIDRKIDRMERKSREEH